MKKKGLVLAVLLLVSFLVFSLSNANTGFTLSVQNITGFSNYTYPDAKIQGEINLTFSGLDKGSILNSSQGDSLDFFNFSRDNNYNILCSPLDCSNSYSLEGNHKDNITLILRKGERKFIGLYFPPTNEEITEVNDLNFTISSNFSEEDDSPLEMILLGEDFEYRTDWKFFEFSNENFSERDYGNYNSSESKDSSVISSNSKYCMEYDIEDLRNLRAGVSLENNDSDNKFIKMELYDSYTYSISECLYNPNSQEGCVLEVTKDEVFSSTPPYYICATSNSSSTDYEILRESGSSNFSGFSVRNTFYINTQDMDRNYAIFIQKAKYANASKINNSAFSELELERDMKFYLNSKYGNNCSSGCLFPIEVYSNVPQELNFKVNRFNYYVGNDGTLNNFVYPMEKKPAKIGFSGVIDLSKTNFKIREEGDYILYLDGKKILEKDVEFKESYRIMNVIPQSDIPSNVLVGLYAIIENNPLNLTYHWDFSDNVTMTSQENYVERIFNGTGTYSLNLSVKDNDGVEGFNEFNLIVVAPTFDVMNRSYNLRKAALENAKENLNEFTYYDSKISDIGNFSYYSSALETVKSYIDNLENGSKTISDILNELNKLDVPRKIDIVNPKNIEYFPYEEKESINGNFVAKKGGLNVSSTELQKYESEILSWEQTYIQAQIISKDIIIEDIYGINKPVLTEYIVNAYSSYPNGDSYLVIDTPGNNVFLMNSSSATKDSSSEYVFIKFNNKPVNFYILNKDNPSPKFFFSTDIDNYNIDETNLICNNNGICERDRGENYQNCRYDCKPVTLIVIWLIVISFVGIGMFFGLKFWFKKNYEKKLFPNRRDLINLMRFVKNAKENKLSRSQIKKELLDAGWSIDRINYAIKKSFKKSEGLEPSQIIKNNVNLSNKKESGRKINKSRKTR